MEHACLYENNPRWDALDADYLQVAPEGPHDWHASPATGIKPKTFRHIDNRHRPTIQHAAKAGKNTCTYDAIAQLDEATLTHLPRLAGAWTWVGTAQPLPHQIRAELLLHFAKVAFPIDVTPTGSEKPIGAASFMEPTLPQETAAYTKIIQEVLELRSDWDHEGGIAPSSEAKRAFVEITAYLDKYLDAAEFEIDSSDGGIALRWFSRDNRSIVSVDIRPSGHAIVVGTNIQGKSSRKSLSFSELSRVLRTAIDAGLMHVVSRVR